MRARKILEGYHKDQLTRGIEVEHEHKEILTKIIKMLKPDISKEELQKLLDIGYEGIAAKHIDEVDNYYDLLDKYIEKP